MEKSILIENSRVDAFDPAVKKPGKHTLIADELPYREWRRIACAFDLAEQKQEIAITTVFISATSAVRTIHAIGVA